MLNVVGTLLILAGAAFSAFLLYLGKNTGPSLGFLLHVHHWGLALANADRLLKVGYSTETTTMGAEFVQKARDSATEAQASANEAKRVSQEIQTMREDLRNVVRSLLVNLVYIDQTTSRATVRQEAFTDLLTQLNNLAVFAYPDKTERHAAMSKLFTHFPPGRQQADGDHLGDHSMKNP